MCKFPRVIAMLLVLVFLTVEISIAGNVGEIPITTKSREAYKIFLKARDLSENIRINEARDLFEKAVITDPNFALACLYRAKSGTSVSDYKTWMQKAVELAPQVSEGERLMIEAAQAEDKNNYEITIEKYKQLVTKYPSDKRSHYFLGMTYRFNEQFDKAIVELKKCIEIDKGFPPAYNILGYCYFNKENYNEAETCFKNYSRLIPGEPNPFDSLGDLYTKMGKHTTAIENYKQALKINPKFHISQTKIGDNLVFLGQYKEARDAYRKTMILELTPVQKIVAMRKIAYSFIYQGKSDQAIAEFDKAIKVAIDNNLPEMHANILLRECNVYYETNQVDKAEECLSKFTTILADSDIPENVRENLVKTQVFHESILKAKQKNFSTALVNAKKYKNKIEASKYPIETMLHSTLLGTIYFEKKDYKTAMKHLSKGYQKDPKTLYMLAVCESESGNNTRAIQLFKKVAHWNENNMSYSFVRNQAIKEEKRLLAGKR